MADNTMDCNSDIPFHQCYAPKSMKWYDLESLDKNEQTNLNKLKIKTIQDNLKYLNDHPEVPIIIELLIEDILEKQPQTNLHEFAAAFFSQPKFDLYKKIHYRLDEQLVKEKYHSGIIPHGDHHSALSVENILKNWSEINEMSEISSDSNSNTQIK